MDKTFEKQVNNIHQMLTHYNMGVELEEVKDLIAIAGYKNLLMYLEDITMAVESEDGVFAFNVYGIGGDKEWAQSKLRLVLNRFEYKRTH